MQTHLSSFFPTRQVRWTRAAVTRQLWSAMALGLLLGAMLALTPQAAQADRQGAATAARRGSVPPYAGKLDRGELEKSWTPAVERQAQKLLEMNRSGALAAMKEDELKDLFRQTDPDVVGRYLALGVQTLTEYEWWLRREERLAGSWPDKPFLNYVKYRHQPRQLYVLWLKGGPKAGQEIIYDETVRADAVYGHLGGLLNVTSRWAEMDGSLVRSNTNHSVRDLGLQSFVEIFLTERQQLLRAGLRPPPDEVEVEDVLDHRTVAMTWIAPAGRPVHYAKKSRVYLDLKLPIIRKFEAWDEAGERIERIVVEKLVPRSFTQQDFDPQNPDYRF